MSLVPLITVFGATGAQGGALARALLQAADRPFRVRAVTRQPGSAAAQALAAQGAEIVAADLDDAAGVERAMRGAHGVFAVASHWAHRSAARTLRQAGHLAEGARRAGVRHVVWSTREDTRRFVEPDGRVMPRLGGRCNVPHFDARGQADQHFIRRGLPLTRLLTSLHWDDLPRLGLWPGRDAAGRLTFVLPMGDARLPGIAAADVGACAAALFRRGEAAIGQRIGIAGEHLDGAQMTRRLARALGEPVRHVAPDPADFARLPVPGAAALANMFRFLRDFNAEVCAVRDVAATRDLHPGLMDFDHFLARHAGGWAGGPAGPPPRAVRRFPHPAEERAR